MKVRTKEMYSEVYSILKLLGDEYITKIPKNLLDMIIQEKLDDYNPEYVLTINIDEQNIGRDTMAMIALLYLKYWTNSIKERNELEAMFKDNEKEYQAEIRKKYNPDNIFKKDNETAKVEETFMIPVYKKSFLKRIIEKIKSIFK